jgi:predicted metalloprotease
MRLHSVMGGIAMAVAFAGVLVPAGGATDGITCASFVSQADAQAVLDADPDDRFGLDPDRNGIACDEAAGLSPSRPTPAPTAAPVRFDDPIAADVDHYWRRAFKKAEREYASLAGFSPLDPLDTSPCGPMPFPSPAFYCSLDQFVYYDDASFADREDGEYGQATWMLMIAHEWGHHAQDALGLLDDYEGDGDPTAYSMAVELQAQCAAGAYVRDALRRKRISQAEVDHAVLVAHTFSGDRVHGTSVLLGDVFERGLAKGLTRCGYPL